MPDKQPDKFNLSVLYFWGHKHSFVMVQTMTYAPENGELRGRKL
mgnify:CR=1 FL=1